MTVAVTEHDRRFFAVEYDGAGKRSMLRYTSEAVMVGCRDEITHGHEQGSQPLLLFV